MRFVGPFGYRDSGARHRLPRYLVFALLLIVFCAGVWLERLALLQGAADLWVVSDPITSADAVVVLGGGADVRPFVAADLYGRGVGHRVLVSQVDDARSTEIGVVPSHNELNVRVLRKLGVPADAIEF